MKRIHKKLPFSFLRTYVSHHYYKFLDLSVKPLQYEIERFLVSFSAPPRTIGMKSRVQDQCETKACFQFH